MPGPLPALCWLPLLVTAVANATALAGDDASSRLTAGAWLVAESHRPARLLRYELVERTWNDLRETPDFARRTRTPEFQRLVQGRRFLERVTNTDWRDALAGLADRVLLAAYSPERPRDVLLAVVPREPKMLESLLAAGRELTAANGVPLPKPEVHAGTSVWRVADTFYAMRGGMLLVSPHSKRVRAAIDALQATTGTTRAEKRVGPLLRVRADLDRLHDRPGVRKLFQQPAQRPGPVLLLGGWFDLLRESHEATLELSETDEGLALAFDIDSSAVADDAGAASEALLSPAGTILSLAWTRDFPRTWAARRERLAAEVVDRLEERDAEIGKQLSVVGLRARPTEVAAMFTGRFRLVVCRQQPSERVPEGDVLPGVAVVAELRDVEDFRERVVPLFRTFGLIVTAQSQMVPENVAHGGVDLVSLRFRDDRKGNRLRFNASPTYGFVDGRFVAGSSVEVVRRVIDELAAEPTGEEARTAIEARGRLSFEELGAAVGDFRGALVRQSMLEDGVAPERARSGLAVLERLVRRLGTARATIDRDERGLHVRLDLSGGPDQ